MPQFPKKGLIMAERFYDGMISEDKGAVANLPQNVVMKEYPKDGSSPLPESINDKLSGIDAQMGMNNSKKNSGMKPKKL
jgi:hypothetical protein